MADNIGEKRDTVVIGASAGGIEALRNLLPALGSELEAAVLIVVHVSASGHSVLDQLLARSAHFQTAFAKDGETIAPRRIYIAPPDKHLLIEDDHLKLWHGPRENRSRPAIDPLFRSAAVARRGRVIGAVLSGFLDDGAAGLASVKHCGGLAFVQAPADAVEAEMPDRAIEALGDNLDGTLPAGELGARIASLVGSPAPAASVPREVELEVKMLLGQVPGLDVLGERSPVPVSCPECGGPLWSIQEGRLQRYRCHTGHAYGTDSLLTAQSTQIEQALWAAVKGLEQRSQMLKGLAREEGIRGRALGARSFEEEAQRLREHAQTLRTVLLASMPAPSTQS